MKTIIEKESAQAGVGTLIIFIAMVLVAAVAAAVLIQTSGVMQEKSTTTTKEAASAIGENILIESIEGTQLAGTMDNLYVSIKVASGGSDIDIAKLLVTVKSSTITVPLKYDDVTVALGANNFHVIQMRGTAAMCGADVLFSSESSCISPVLKAGDLVKIKIDPTLAGGGLGLVQKGSIIITLTPEKGTSVNLPATLPAFTGPTVQIYP